MQRTLEEWENLLSNARGGLVSVTRNFTSDHTGITVQTFTFEVEHGVASLFNSSFTAIERLMELERENEKLRFKLEEYSMIISELETELEYAEAEIAQYKPDIRKSRCVL